MYNATTADDNQYQCANTPNGNGPAGFSNIRVCVAPCTCAATLTTPDAFWPTGASETRYKCPEDAVPVPGDST